MSETTFSTREALLLGHEVLPNFEKAELPEEVIAFYRSRKDQIIPAIRRGFVLPTVGGKNEVITVERKIKIPTLHSTGPTLAEWLKAREELHQFFTGESVVLRDIFAFTDEELVSTALMPAFRPAGATNQMAVEWKRRMGVSVFVEGEDKGGVMLYKNSKGLKGPELYLINRSVRPDEDTLGENAKSPDGLIVVPGKLWLGLFGWCDADTLHFAIEGTHLDPNIWSWFPADRLPYDREVALGNSDGGKVWLDWYARAYCYPLCGARSAKKVPLKP